jgi:serine/threonine protein kinase
MTPNQSAAVAVELDSPLGTELSAIQGTHTAVSAARIGSTLGGRFVVQALLVPGESGDFFAALDTGTTPQGSLGVVIKIAHAPAADKRAGEAFRHEYNQARRLSNPNIARVNDFIADSGGFGYTLDLPPGRSLADSLPDPLDGRLSRDYAWAVISAVGAALVHAHLREVIHGALSVRSIWLTEDRQLRLLDFGSRPPPGESPPSETAQALPWSMDVERYASCEVLAGLAPRASDDLYSLSCLAYELLAGQHPWDGAAATTARDRALRLARPPGLKSAAWRTLKAGLALSRDRRPNSVREWLASLNWALKDDRLPVMTVTPAPKASRMGREAVIAVAVLAALGCSLWIWHSARRETVTTAPAAESVAATTAPPIPSTESPAVVEPIEAVSPAPVSAQPTAAPSLAAAVPSPAVPPSPAAAQSVAMSEAPKASPTATRPMAIGGGLWFSQAQYTVAPNSRFVEVHVLRRGSARETEFQWWTEAGAALAGVDFHSQAPATQIIKAGAPGTSLFIRVPESKVAHRSFRVCVNRDPSAAAPAHVCAKILL